MVSMGSHLGKVLTNDENLEINLQGWESHLDTISNPKGSDTNIARYFVRLDVVATKYTLYIPVSIASGRVSTGFVYQIEGTGEAIASATIASQGKDTTRVTFGSIEYCKIPPGKIASFKIITKVKGKRPKKYKFVLSRINYKLNPNDSRYKRVLTEISTDFIQLRRDS